MIIVRTASVDLVSYSSRTVSSILIEVLAEQEINVILLLNSYLKNESDSVVDDFLLGGGVARPAHEVEHGAHHVLHLLPGDEPVPVLVVERKRPPKFLLQGPADQNGETHSEILREEKENKA